MKQLTQYFGTATLTHSTEKYGSKGQGRNFQFDDDDWTNYKYILSIIVGTIIDEEIDEFNNVKY